MASLLLSHQQLLTEYLHHQVASQCLGSGRISAPLDQELDSYDLDHKHHFQGVLLLHTKHSHSFNQALPTGFYSQLKFPDYISQTPLKLRVIMGQSSRRRVEMV